MDLDHLPDAQRFIESVQLDAASRGLRLGFVPGSEPLILSGENNRAVSSAASAQMGEWLLSEIERIVQPTLRQQRKLWDAVILGNLSKRRDLVSVVNERGLGALFDATSLGPALIEQTVSSAVRNLNLMITRLRGDLDVIRDRLGIDAAFLNGVECGLSDPHGGLQSVAKLTFADGKAIIYKPRDLGPEELWAKAIRDLSGGALLVRRISAANVINRLDYGWMEAVEPDCADQTDDGSHRCIAFGALSALAWTLSLNDLHVENVSWTARGICALDVEAIAHPDLTSLIDRWIGSQGSPARPENCTVSLTGLFPTLVPVTEKYIDIGGFQSLGLAATRQRTALIARSFRNTVFQLARHPEMLDRWATEALRLERRVILRPTAFYQLALARLREPDLLSNRKRWDDRAQEICTHGTARTPTATQISTTEVAALAGLDVPRFSLSNLDELLSGQPAVPMADLPGRRLSGLRRPELNAEVRQILALFRQHSGVGKQVRAPCGNLAATADFLLKRMLAGRSAQALATANLLVPVGPGLAQLQPVGLGLYSGLAGIGLALVAHGQAFSMANIADQGCAILKLALEQYDRQSQRLSRGLDGAAGLAYALAYASRATDNANLSADAARLAGALMEHKPFSPLDTVGGSTGEILCMLRCAEIATDGDLRVKTLALADSVLPKATDIDLLNRQTRTGSNWGHAHGLAGVLHACDRAAHLSGDPRFISARDALRSKLLRHLEAVLNNTDRQKGPEPERGWCNGIAGILLALGPDLDQSLLQRGARLIAQPQTVQPRRYSLCCGTLGIMDVLIELDERCESEVLSNLRARESDKLLKSLHSNGTRFQHGADQLNISLFRGLAGLLFTLARISSPRRVPSVLLIS